MEKFCKYCGKSTNTKGFQCNNCVSRIRRLERKTQAVNYKGGKCERCGYKEHIAALEFHHIDPDNKDFNIGNHMNKNWEFVKKELDKCVLLCSNCHRIEHSKYEETSSLVREANWSAKPTE